ncbi:mitochondrial peptide methionine sulfoxide reductase isoform X2 [Sander lucioperca]|uniref:mitochondrial peptide methionine sulfoxide reductase isoform X2 n=1 Tax=Sander lucioperca TaxID=283035 RepID=UPI00125DEC7F|nr:mitochondrial peptide methionine sulfoxide reductase isoform X2 [Sander lucioperca]
MVSSSRLRLVWRHFINSRMGEMASKAQMTTPEAALPGRTDCIKVSAKHDVNGNRTVPPFPEGTEMAIFGRTGHAEVVRVVYHPEKTSFTNLLTVFWESHNPTQGMRQGNDIGTAYRSAIYTDTKQQLEEALASKDQYQKVLTEEGFGAITTEIAEAKPFYYAEDYHQQYLSKNPDGYCGLGGTGVSCPIGIKTKA